MRRALEWGDLVTIIDCDMRTWNAPEKADILISELLGSFGDNELSPECLDGAQRFLHRLFSNLFFYISYSIIIIIIIILLPLLLLLLLFFII